MFISLTMTDQSAFAAEQQESVRVICVSVVNVVQYTLQNCVRPCVASMLWGQ